MAPRKAKAAEPVSPANASGLLLSREDLAIVKAAIPWFAAAARREAAVADLRMVENGVGKVDELHKNDHLRRQADAALRLGERIADFLHHGKGDA